MVTWSRTAVRDWFSCWSLAFEIAIASPRRPVSSLTTVTLVSMTSESFVSGLAGTEDPPVASYWSITVLATWARRLSMIWR